MGLAYEVLTGRATNPGATPTALTANAGDTFTVRSFPFESGAFLEGIWAKGGTAGIVRVTSPRLHDQVQGLRLPFRVNTPRNLVPDEAMQRLFPQDALSVAITGGAAETDVGAIAVYYRDLPGIDARLATWDQVQSRIEHILSAEVAVAAAGTLGDWSAGTALNATFDLLKNDVNYAILGYESSVEVAAIAVRGPDTGNLRVGGPGAAEEVETRNWFVDQTRAKGTPHIPVINASNKGATLVFQANNLAGAVNNVNLILAQLAPG